MAIETKRNIDQVTVGAPDIAFGGGFVIGKPAKASGSVPTDMNTDLSTTLAQKSVGFISEDGVSVTTDTSYEAIKDWNLDKILSLESERNVTVKFTAKEFGNIELLKWVFGKENVTDSSGTIKIKVGAKSPRVRSLDIKTKFGQGGCRLFAPAATVTALSDIVFKKGETTDLELEVDCGDPYGLGAEMFVFVKNNNTAEEEDED